METLTLMAYCILNAVMTSLVLLGMSRINLFPISLQVQLTKEEFEEMMDEDNKG